MDNLDFNYFCLECNKSIEYRKANCFTRYKIKHYKAGENIAYKGQPAKQLSMLVEGSVSTEIVLDSGVSLTSRIHHAPYPFGALALFAQDNSYRADIVALEDSRIIAISRDVIEQQMSECRIFLRSFIAYNTSKLDVFTRHLTVLTHKSLKSKLAFYILSISKDRRFSFDKKLDALAVYLCVERPSLSRVLSQLVGQNIISYNRGKGEIIDIIVLKNMIE